MNDTYPRVSGVRRRPKNNFHQKARNEKRAGSGSPADDGFEKTDGNASRARPGGESEPRRRWEEDRPRKALPYYGVEEEAESGFKFPFDPWRLFGALKKNFGWILLGGGIFALVGVLLGTLLVQYQVGLPLLRKQTPNAFRADNSDPIAPREYSDQTLFTFMKSGEVLRRVALQAATNAELRSIHVTPKQLAESIQVRPSPNPDVIVVSLSAFDNLKAMVELVNLYGKEVVQYTREIQQMEAADLNKYLQGKLAEAEAAVQQATLALRTNYSQTGLGDFERETEAELKRFFDLKDKLQSKLIERDTLAQKIATRQQQLARQTPENTKLAQAEAELRIMLGSMTEAHPLVVAKRKEIETLKNTKPDPSENSNGLASSLGNNGLYMQVLDLQSQLPALEKEIMQTEAAITNLQTRLGNRTETGVRYAMKKGELQSLQATQQLLTQKQRQAQLMAENAMGYFSVLAPASMGSINYTKRWLKVVLLGMGVGFVGLIGSLMLVMLAEAMDTTLKTSADVTRITHLPVLATLGDLRKMSPSAQVNWAFRTLTILRGKLSKNPDQALVCGIISSGPREGRSTWVNLLVSAASQRGLKVLTVDTRPASEGPVTSTTTGRDGKASEGAPKKNEGRPPENASENNTCENQAHSENGHACEALTETLNTNVLMAPGKVAEQLEKQKEQPVVHIPLPGWVWSLERRKQWEKALDYWRKIDNLVIFVELPPASQSEAVLLAEHVPQLIWLTGSGMADASETAAQIEVLRHARCNLVGAVLNQAPPPFVNAKLAKWFTKMTALLVLGTGLMAPVHAQENPESTKGTDAEKLVFSGTNRKKRAAWQEKLTFGPGDVMDIHLFGSPTLTRTNVFVGPDGRISYLQAQGVKAAGLTVEELRTKLDEALGKYYTAPKSIVIPVAFPSKKYYMLGKVAGRGVYQMDRPLTIIEAVARAKGLETGMYQRNSVEMADLTRSFIVRNGKKLEVDFQKLFLDGDLSQNIILEPDDYLFFASAAANDIYVLGEVFNPGPIGFLPNATVLTAITDRGGFTDRAFKKRVLVVRGSLNEPETFVVDSGGILDARVKDFALQPKDIVYVSRRPWNKVEELADEAVQSFIQGAVTTWAGFNVGPVIKSQILPDLK